MQLLDLNAPIVPGKAAAGFSIGMNIEDICSILATAKKVDYFEGFNLVKAITENCGVLYVRGFVPNESASVYFGPDTVRLSFNLQGVLGCIYVFSNYLGTYENFKIGCPLSLVAAKERLAYEDGDEMYYLVDSEDEYRPGLAIVAAEAEPQEYSETPIQGFCVHDWSMFRST